MYQELKAETGKDSGRDGEKPKTSDGNNGRKTPGTDADSGGQGILGDLSTQTDDTEYGLGDVQRDHSATGRGNTAGTVSNFRITDEDNIGGGNDKVKAKQNIEAIKLVKQLESEGRFATPEEQKILAKYVGWGGLKNVFERKYVGNNTYVAKFPDWEKEFNEVKELLTKEEWNSASESTQNAHYTSPEIIKTMYAALDRLGLRAVLLEQLWALVTSLVCFR